MKSGIEFISTYIKSLLASIWLFTCGFFKKRNRDLMHEMARHFGLEKTREIELPKSELEDVLEKVSTQIRLIEPSYREGNVTMQELASIIQLVSSFKPGNIFEIGTFDGRTTLNMAANSSENTRIFTLDLPKQEMNSTKLDVDEYEKKWINKDQSGTRFIGTEFERKITQLYGDSATFDFSPYKNSMDMVFVDGSHAYDYVINDTKAALEMIGDRKGIIAWHDYIAPGWSGVTKALEEFFLERSDFGDIRHIRGTTLAVLVKKA